MRIPNTYLLEEKMNTDNEKSFLDYNQEAYKPLDMIDRMEDLKDDKSYKKLIKNIESIVRTSFEYQEFRNYLIHEIDMNQCAFIKGLDMTDSRRIKVEIHHTPFTLYDLVEIVVNKHKTEKGQIFPLDVAEEVMGLHYRGVVGLIPLSTTVHELVHSGIVFVPIHYVYGNFAKFISEYDSYISISLKNTLIESIDISSKFIKVPDILKPKYLYMEEGFSLPKSEIFK